MIKRMFKAEEKKGFANTFWSPWHEYEKHNGKPFRILSRYFQETTIDGAPIPAWIIRLSTGEELIAHAEEIIKTEQITAMQSVRTFCHEVVC